MKIFKTTAVMHDEEGVTLIYWGASQTEAAADRKHLKADARFTVTTQTVNIPTAKGPLVAWLNENARG